MSQETELDRGSYREILALIKGLEGSIASQGERITETNKDAREARDAARALVAATEAQAIPSKLAELKGAIEQVAAASRSDLVNSANKITTEMRDGLHAHETRIEVLEAFMHKLEGAGGAFGWLSKNAPWLLSVMLGALAVFGLKDRLP